MNDMEHEDQSFIAEHLRGAVNATSSMPIYPGAVRAEATRRRRKGLIAGGVSLGVAGAAVALIVTTLGAPPPGMVAPAETPSQQLVPAATNPPPQGPTGIMVNQSKAAASAPLVEIFWDYQCPACADFAEQFAPMFESLAADGKIQLEYHLLTILDTSQGNDSSTRAAVGARCAAASLGGDEFRLYHASVFANQPANEGGGFADDLLRDKIPQQIGYGDDPEFQKCYDNRETAAAVALDAEYAAIEGVAGVPTVQVNGEDLAVTGAVANVSALEDFIKRVAVQGQDPEPTAEPTGSIDSQEPQVTAEPYPQVTFAPDASWKRHELANVGVSVQLPKNMVAFWDREFDDGWRLDTTATRAGKDMKEILVWPESLAADGPVSGDVKDEGVVGELTDAAGRPVHLGLLTYDWGDEYLLMVNDSGGWNSLIDFGKGKFYIGSDDNWYPMSKADHKIVAGILASVRNIG